jgi:hypothetical protein
MDNGYLEQRQPLLISHIDIAPFHIQKKFDDIHMPALNR